MHGRISCEDGNVQDECKVYPRVSDVVAGGKAGTLTRAAPHARLPGLSGVFTASATHATAGRGLGKKIDMTTNRRFCCDIKEKQFEAGSQERNSLGGDNLPSAGLADDVVNISCPGRYYSFIIT